jgi:predicted anti-sigma-YlaC factor YlaD
MSSSGHPTECLQARVAASARLDAPLSELDEARLEAHHSACADCRAYAAEVAAIAALLRAAPLDQPGAPMFAPRHRRPVVRVHAAMAAAVLLAAAIGSSFALGRAIGGHRAVTATATGPAEILSLRADSTQQHLLAMISRFGSAGRPNVGRAIAL